MPSLSLPGSNSLAPVQPAAPKIGLIAPIYSDTEYAGLASAALANPTVPVIAIVNPAWAGTANTAPSYDATMAAGIATLKAAGVTVLGYMWTCYGTRIATGSTGTFAYSSCGTVGGSYRAGWQDDINQYIAYNYNLDGIWLDQMSAGAQSSPNYTVAQLAQYYQNVETWVHTKGFQFCGGNAGAMPNSAFFGTQDVICIYEGAALPTPSSLAS